MLVYRAALPLSAQTLSYVAGVIPPPGGDRLVLAQAQPGRQALLVLVHLRKDIPGA
jgi:hypothetical protein